MAGNMQGEAADLKSNSTVIQLTASPLFDKASPLPTPPPANLQWSGIAYQVLDTMSMSLKTVLTGCVGSASAGETVALMGPSGAGSSLPIKQAISKAATCTVCQIVAGIDRVLDYEGVEGLSCTKVAN